MSVRTLDLLDLPTLYQYRHKALGFDATRALTRGDSIGGVGLGTYVNPSRHVFGAVAERNGASLLGGVLQNRGDPFARLLYLAPASRVDHPDLPALLDKLAEEAGNWGAFHVVAEVDEDSEAFPSLRQAGFSVYAWQRMWDLSDASGGEDAGWERVRPIHLPAIQSLYQQIVPPLLQPVEQMPRHPSGYICSETVKCYTSNSAGAYGIVLHPLIHPEATQVSSKLLGLVNGLQARRRRRIYICVRSYQAWLEHVIADLGGKPGPRQAVMVKHLAHLVKEEQAERARQPAGVSVQATRVSRYGTHK